MNILAIQSQVIYGHVGHSAAVLAWQRQGLDALAVPVAVLAHHPGHGPAAGRLATPAEIRALVGGLAARGLLASCAGMLTGWLGSAALARAALAAVAQTRATNPSALYLCDPVIGDRAPGIYVQPRLAAFIRDRMLPQADIVTPNQFEAEWLSGIRIAGLGDALAAADALLARGPKIAVCTSLTREDGDPGHIETLAVTREGAWLAATPELAGTPHGAGDLFAAVFLARLLKGKSVKKALAFAVGAVFGVLERSVAVQSPEMTLVAAQENLVRPRFEPATRRVR